MHLKNTKNQAEATYGDGTVFDSVFCSHGDNFPHVRDAEQMQLCMLTLCEKSI